jgi:predicted hotdog family 3-hydroxylacyl-ACP dehydratase
VKRCDYAIDQVLPHAGPMILLDEVAAYSADRLEAAVEIRSDSRFIRAQGMPAHVIIEYMAQACSAFSGIEALDGGGSPRVGYLLGTRAFRAHRSWIGEGELLAITADLVYRDEEMSVFDCRAVAGSDEIAFARLTVYQPATDDRLVVGHD